MLKLPRLLLLAATLLAITIAGCIPVSVPGLRNIDGQTWAARFEVEVRPGDAVSIRMPVNIALTFSQELQNVKAQASVQYDAGLFRLQTPSLVDLQGRLGFDDHLSLQSSSNLLGFDGRFVGGQLRGTVSLAGLVPVSDVTFVRQ